MGQWQNVNEKLQSINLNREQQTENVLREVKWPKEQNRVIAKNCSTWTISDTCLISIPKRQETEHPNGQLNKQP